MYKFGIGDCVQFNDKHNKWYGCFGFVTEIKDCGNDVRYMVGVPIPMEGTAYIFTMESANEIEYVGESLYITVREDKE